MSPKFPHGQNYGDILIHNWDIIRVFLPWTHQMFNGILLETTQLHSIDFQNTFNDCVDRGFGSTSHIRRLNLSDNRGNNSNPLYARLFEQSAFCFKINDSRINTIFQITATHH